MCLHTLADVFAVRWLRWNDFLHPGYARLPREFGQQRNRHIGFDIVLAHITRVAAVGYQEVRHVLHIAGEVNGHCHRTVGVNGSVRGGARSRLLSLLNRSNELVEVGP